MGIKRVWFVSHYSMPPEYEMRIKTQMYAHYLGLRGIDCTIFSASTIHNTDVNLITGNEQYIERTYDDLKFVHIKCDQYSGNGYARIKNMLQFASRFARIANRFPLPDIVVADANCINYEKIYKFCKSHNIPILIDNRDLWPMSIVEYYKFIFKNIIIFFSNSNPIIQYLYHRERKMYQRVDGIIFATEGGSNYISDKGWDEIPKTKCYYINNGVNLDEFYNQIKENAYPDPDLDDNSSFKVVYAGSIRVANNLETVVFAAEKMPKDSNIRILLYGDGEDKPRLEQYCKDREISNVIFKGQVGKKYIPYILSKCNLSILNYKKAKTLKYGGSQNKLFEYLAAGCPVLLTVDMNYNIVTKNDCGITLDEPDPAKIAEAIIKISQLSPEELNQMGERAKKVAAEYDFKVLTKRLLRIMEEKVK